MEETLYKLQLWDAMFIPTKSRKAMKGYSRSKEDYREKLILKYNQYTMEEVLGCLWDWAENTDYVLCEWDSDLLPPLVKKDEIRFQYNQYKNTWSYVSCTVFAAIGMLSDLINYEFSYDQIKEVDELTYTTDNYPKRTRWEWYWVKYAVWVLADWYNASELSKKYWKVAYYRISKYDDDILEWALDKLYTLDWNLHLTDEYYKDREDWMIDWTDFWHLTNWHSIDIIKNNGQRSVKDSGSNPEKNIYWIRNKLSKVTNFWPSLYIYVLVGDNLERVKKLNEIKAKIVNWMDLNSELWHLSNSELHKDKLHDMNNFYRDWLSYIDGELKGLV